MKDFLLTCLALLEVGAIVVVLAVGVVSGSKMVRQDREENGHG